MFERFALLWAGCALAAALAVLSPAREAGAADVKCPGGAMYWATLPPLGPDDELNSVSGRAVCTWDFANGRLKHVFAIDDTARIVGPPAYVGDRILVPIAGNEHLTIWDLRHGKSVSSPLPVARRAAVAASGKYAVIQHDPIEIWSIRGPRFLASLAALPEAEQGVALLPTAEAFISLPERFVSEHHPTLWDMTKRTKVKEFAGLDEQATALDVSFDGTHLVAASRSGQVALWEISGTGETPAKALRTDGAPQLIGLSADKSVVALVKDEGKAVEMWNLDAQRLISSFRTKFPVRGLTFARDGKRIAVAGASEVRQRYHRYFRGSLETHDTATGGIIWTLKSD